MSREVQARHALGPLCALLERNEADLAKATERLRESNDRLAAVLGPDWVRELAERDRGVPVTVKPVRVSPWPPFSGSGSRKR